MGITSHYQDEQGNDIEQGSTEAYRLVARELKRADEIFQQQGFDGLLTHEARVIKRRAESALRSVGAYMDTLADNLDRYKGDHETAHDEAKHMLDEARRTMRQRGDF